MKITKKIKAFTLSELLVVIVISSIVVSLAILILLMVQKQIKSIQSNLDKKQEIQFLERALWQDFNTYAVSYQKEKDILFLTNSIDSVIYVFNEGYVIREKDTMSIELIDKKIFLDGNLVTSGVIDGIQIETSAKFGFKKMFIYKSKSATHYLND